jgi:hypothetical protein
MTDASRLFYQDHTTSGVRDIASATGVPDLPGRKNVHFIIASDCRALVDKSEQG